MAYDRSDFRALFYQECDRCLTGLDEVVGGLDWSEPSTEAFSEAHRMVHTISGDAAIVGFEEVAGFSRKLEALLAGLRRGSVEPSADVISVLDEARRMLRLLVDARREESEDPDADAVERLKERLAELSDEPEGSA